MNDTLTSEQIEGYREAGFLAIPDFLDDEEIQTWRAVLDESLRRRGTSPLPRTGSDVRADGTTIQKDTSGQTDYYANIFTQRLNLWMDNVAMKDLILDARIGQMACELEGIEGIRVWHDQALVKPPWGNGTPWHLDNPYWSFYSRHAVSIWIALDDATLENGCLYFLPGSHKMARFENVDLGPNMGALLKHYPEWAKTRAVPVPVKAGGCTFHNGLTAHAAGPNMTPHPRRAMTCAFMPDGARFNGQRNVLPKALFERLGEGDRLDDEGQNPLVYSQAVHEAT